MMEVTVAKRRRSWEWRVCDHDGTLIMHGRERSRPAARYQGYRMLFMMLAVGRRSHETASVRGSPSVGSQPPLGVRPGAPSASSPPVYTGLSPSRRRAARAGKI